MKLLSDIEYQAKLLKKSATRRKDDRDFARDCLKLCAALRLCWQEFSDTDTPVGPKKMVNDGIRRRIKKLGLEIND
jgi:hypothetical protein